MFFPQAFNLPAQVFPFRVAGGEIRAALEAGEIEATRYDSYLRLYEKASQIKTWEIKQEQK